MTELTCLHVTLDKSLVYSPKMMLSLLSSVVISVSSIFLMI